MSKLFEQVAAGAGQLSQPERRILAERILSNLDEDCLSEIDEAWIVEAEKRYDAYLADKSRGIAPECVINAIRRELE